MPCQYLKFENRGLLISQLQFFYENFRNAVNIFILLAIQINYNYCVCVFFSVKVFSIYYKKLGLQYVMRGGVKVTRNTNQNISTIICYLRLVIGTLCHSRICNLCFFQKLPTMARKRVGRPASMPSLAHAGSTMPGTCGSVWFQP